MFPILLFLPFPYPCIWSLQASSASWSAFSWPTGENLPTSRHPLLIGSVLWSTRAIIEFVLKFYMCFSTHCHGKNSTQFVKNRVYVIIKYLQIPQSTKRHCVRRYFTVVSRKSTLPCLPIGTDSIHTYFGLIGEYERSRHYTLIVQITDMQGGRVALLGMCWTADFTTLQPTLWLFRVEIIL